MSRRLIVNADGIGRSRGVNEDVLEAHRRGIITSATLLVNCPAAAEVRDLAADCPALGIGLCVQMTDGPSTLPRERVPSLLDPDGASPPKPDGLEEADPAEVLAEARAQLQRFRELLGRDPTHFDSHDHSHRVPAVFAAVVALAKETGRPVRATDDTMAALLRREGIRATDRFVDDVGNDTITLAALLALVRDLPEGTTEMAYRPAAIHAERSAIGGRADSRDQADAVLTSAVARDAIRDAGVELVSFAAL